MGGFIGPAGVHTPYLGELKGPLRWQLSDDVSFVVKDGVKVLKSSEPLVLLGTDAMQFDDENSEWAFLDIGFERRSRAGIMRWEHKPSAKVRTVRLLAWPRSGRPKASDPPDRTLLVHDQEHEVAADYRALLLERGQRV